MSSPHEAGLLLFDNVKVSNDGFAHRPAGTFGTVTADVPAHFDPTFHRIDFVDVIHESS